MILTKKKKSIISNFESPAPKFNTKYGAIFFFCLKVDTEDIIFQVFLDTFFKWPHLRIEIIFYWWFSVVGSKNFINSVSLPFLSNPDSVFLIKHHKVNNRDIDLRLGRIYWLRIFECLEILCFCYWKSFWKRNKGKKMITNGWEHIGGK